MKEFGIICGCVLLMLGVVCQAELVGHWRLDDPNIPGADPNNLIAVDETGRYDGHYVGTPQVGTGNNVLFSGDDEISGFPVLPAMNQITLAFWVNINGAKTTEHMIAARTPTYNKPWTVQINAGTGSSRVLRWIEGNKVGVDVSVPTNQWIHVVITSENLGGASRVYVNGVLAGENVATPGFVDDGTSPLWIGRRATSTAGKYFQGMLDDFQMYDTVVSGDEAMLLYLHPDATLSQFKAGNLSPAPGATNVSPTATLSWTAPEAGSPTGYYVYLGTDPANLALVTPTPLSPGTTTYDPAGDLAKNTWYYWRVDVDPNDGGPGFLWSFQTELSLPDLNMKLPADVRTKQGATVVFAADATDPLGGTLGYKWYYDPTIGSDGDEMLLSDGDRGGRISGATSSQLNISAVEQSDEGGYFAMVSNVNAGIPTRTASLMTERIIAHYTLDDPNGASLAVDSVGGYDGVYEGTPAMEQASAYPSSTGSSVGFSGDDAITDFPTLPIMNQITLAFWMNINGAKTNEHMVTARTATYNNPWTVQINAGTGASRTLRWIEGNKVAVDTSVSTGQWVHVVITSENLGGASRVYINGVMKAEKLATPGFTDNGSPFWIGRRGTSTANLYFQGSLDDLRIYNYAMTPVEAAALYTGMAGGEVCLGRPEFDFNGDCRTDLSDLALFAADWLSCNLVPTCITP